jgi:hypothetical protein
MQIKTINIPKTILVITLGISLILSIHNGHTDISLAIGGGLIGYLSKDITDQLNEEKP